MASAHMPVLGYACTGYLEYRYAMPPIAANTFFEFAHSRALKIATLQKKNAPIHPPYISFYGRMYEGDTCNVKT